MGSAADDAAACVLGAAAFIWIFIKLPQEYWIHVAQLDTTDLIKEDILGVPSDTPWGEAHERRTRRWCWWRCS